MSSNYEKYSTLRSFFSSFFFSQVGKTSLMKRYVANDYTDKRRPTIGADFMTKEIVAGDQPMLLQVI